MKTEHPEFCRKAGRERLLPPIFTMRILEIGANDASVRLDKFLSKAVKALPASLMYKLIRTKKIKVNRKRAYPDQILCTGDTVQLFISEEFFSDDAEDISFTKLAPKLDIVYEDENIILCSKRAGMLVHPDDSESVNTLISHIKAYLYRKGEYVPERENSFAPALCNRIDRNTEGIVIAAKNAEALRILNEKIKLREVKKRYLCAAHGHFEKQSGRLIGYMVKDQKNNTVTVYSKKPEGQPDAKQMITDYRVVSEKNGLSLLEIDLITGRTHQIRAHLSSIGHPLLGDGKYGVNREDRHMGYKYQALYAYKLTFDFVTDARMLNYLNGKTFEVERSKIWFLQEFNN